MSIENFFHGFAKETPVLYPFWSGSVSLLQAYALKNSEYFSEVSYQNEGCENLTEISLQQSFYTPLCDKYPLIGAHFLAYKNNWVHFIGRTKRLS